MVTGLSRARAEIVCFRLGNFGIVPRGCGRKEFCFLLVPQREREKEQYDFARRGMYFFALFAPPEFFFGIDSSEVGKENGPEIHVKIDLSPVPLFEFACLLYSLVKWLCQIQLC